MKWWSVVLPLLFAATQATVTVFTPETLEAAMSDEEIILMVNYCVKGTKNCDSFSRIFEGVAQAYKEEPNVVVGTVDVGEYPSMAAKYKVHRQELLPDVWFYRDSGKTSHRYFFELGTADGVVANFNDFAAPMIFPRLLNGKLVPEGGQIGPLHRVALKHMRGEGSDEDHLQTLKEFAANMTGVHAFIAKHYVKTFEKSLDDPEYVKRQSERLWSLLDGGGSMNARQRLEIEARLDVLESFDPIDVRIPKNVYYFKCDGNPDIFSLMHYLSIKSAHYWIQPDNIYFVGDVEPKTEWWEKVKPYVTFRKSKCPEYIGDKKLKLAAHKSDVFRLETLIKEGGIYLDWDVIVLKPFDDLLTHKVAMGVEKYGNIIGNSIIVSRPQAGFLKLWLRQMPSKFSYDCYTCHAGLFAWELAQQHEDMVHIFNWKKFFYPGWEHKAMYHLFKETEGDFSDTYAMHMFESNKNFHNNAGDFSEKWIRTSNSNFAKLVRPFLD